MSTTVFTDRFECPRCKAYGIHLKYTRDEARGCDIWTVKCFNCNLSVENHKSILDRDRPDVVTHDMKEWAFKSQWKYKYKDTYVDENGDEVSG